MKIRPLMILQKMHAAAIIQEEYLVYYYFKKDWRDEFFQLGWGGLSIWMMPFFVLGLGGGWRIGGLVGHGGENS